MQTPGGRATLNLDGRITTASFGWVATRLYLVGRITTASSGHLYVVRLNLTGRITTAATARMRTPPITGPTENLNPGLITAIAAAQLNRPAAGQSLSGSPITAAMVARLSPPAVGQGLSGRIVATLRLRLDRPWGLVGRIKATSSAGLAGLPLPDARLGLSGQITTISAGRFRGPPNAFLAGTITTIVKGRIARAGELFAARALTVSGLLGGALQFGTYFVGRIKTTAWAGITGTAAILSGWITSASFGRLRNLPLLPTSPPPDCKLDVTLDDYLDLITSEHVGKPLYTQTVTASVQPYVDDQLLTAEMPCSFDVDIAVGEQLDFTGQWIGKTRFVNLPDVFFSWDAHGLGWDEANWRGPFDPPEALLRLDDDHYRLLLYATIAANHWDGSIPNAYTAWDTLFAGTGYQVVVQDYGNMTMMLGLRSTSGHLDAVTQALFQSGDMDLKPEGISLLDYVFQAEPNTPFFAWDANTDAAAGWDTGYWGILVPPGQGFVPE